MQTCVRCGGEGKQQRDGVVRCDACHEQIAKDYQALEYVRALRSVRGAIHHALDEAQYHQKRYPAAAALFEVPIRQLQALSTIHDTLIAEGDQRDRELDNRLAAERGRGQRTHI